MKIRLYTYYIGSLVFLFILAGCSQTEDELPVSQTAIGVDVQDTQTKGLGENTKDKESILSLGLYAYNTGDVPYDALNPAHIPNLMHDREVSRTDASSPWIYSSNAYWPIDETAKNTFFAYSPHSSKFPTTANVVMSGSTASGYPMLTYTVPSEGTDQVDVLYSEFSAATYGINKDINKNTKEGKVLYNMKHATAWIAFLIAPLQKNSPAEIYTIKSLQFSAKNFVTRGRFDIGTALWTGEQATNITYNLPVNPVPTQVGEIHWATPENYRLMIIPQPITRDLNESTISMSYSFENGHDDDAGEFAYSVPFPETTFGVGRVTIYVLNVTVDGITIKFLEENSIEVWKSGGSKTIEVY